MRGSTMADGYFNVTFVSLSSSTHAPEKYLRFIARLVTQGKVPWRLVSPGKAPQQVQF